MGIYPCRLVNDSGSPTVNLWFVLVLSVSDMLTVVLIGSSSAVRQVSLHRQIWLNYDAFVYIPIASITTTVSPGRKKTLNNQRVHDSL